MSWFLSFFQKDLGDQGTCQRSWFFDRRGRCSSFPRGTCLVCRCRKWDSSCYLCHRNKISRCLLLAQGCGANCANVLRRTRGTKWSHTLFQARSDSALPHVRTPPIHVLTPKKMNTSLAPYYLLKSAFWQNFSFKRMDTTSSYPKIFFALKIPPQSSHPIELLRWNMVLIRMMPFNQRKVVLALCVQVFISPSSQGLLTRVGLYKRTHLA